ncbi:MAG TPA: hypothetical protein VMI53_14340 [Opitutaceae bacterium]|nr:hypothetical protein [Opitutaceae bacterium]
MPAANPVCPHCGGATVFEEKHTFTGREVRAYRCTVCGHSVTEDCGVALWQVLHDANEAAVARPQPPSPPPKKSWWKFWKR